MNRFKSLTALWFACGAALLAACASGASENRDEPLAGYALGDRTGQASTVNRYLWAASLETLDFLPVFQADPIAGLIITDWYADPRSPQERFKVSVYILDKALRADALRVSVFKQAQNLEGQWIDSTVNPATGREIENSILTRARQLRLNQLDE
ncbi:MAG: DUF3576 domain-containing protein [Alphaproteobacteria bacterium]|nr:DUF3576 domain-containing protein [Alphaproteobacteria bacterium]